MNEGGGGGRGGGGIVMYNNNNNNDDNNAWKKPLSITLAQVSIFDSTLRKDGSYFEDRK